MLLNLDPASDSMDWIQSIHGNQGQDPMGKNGKNILIPPHCKSPDFFIDDVDAEIFAQKQSQKHQKFGQHGDNHTGFESGLNETAQPVSKLSLAFGSSKTCQSAATPSDAVPEYSALDLKSFVQAEPLAQNQESASRTSRFGKDVKNTNIRANDEKKCEPESEETQRSAAYSDDENSDDEGFDSDRSWATVFVRDSFMDSGDLFHIQHRTRRELPRNTVESRLYSSLKYVILLDTSEKHFKQEAQFLMARVFVIDDESFQPVDDKLCGKPLSGVIESALTKQPDLNGVLKGQLFVQLSNSLSYHKHKRKFCLEIRYYSPEDLENEVLIKRSPPFRIYARKPNSKKGSSRGFSDGICLPEKRKRSEGELDESSQSSPFQHIGPNTSMRTGQRCGDHDSTQTSSHQPDHVTSEPKKDFNAFLSKLNDLFSFLKNDLSSQDRQLASAVLYHRVLELHAYNYDQENPSAFMGNQGGHFQMMNMLGYPGMQGPQGSLLPQAHVARPSYLGSQFGLGSTLSIPTGMRFPQNQLSSHMNQDPSLRQFDSFSAEMRSESMSNVIKNIIPNQIPTHLTNSIPISNRSMEGNFNISGAFVPQKHRGPSGPSFPNNSAFF